MPAIKKQNFSKKTVMPSLVKYEEEHFVDTKKPVWNYSLFNKDVINNFRQGTLYNAYEK